jgi:competence protein ComEA
MPFPPLMIRLPYFSRSQLGVILLLAASLLGLYAWRAHWLWAPSPPPPGTLSLAFVEVSGTVPHPGVYSFPRPPSLKEVWVKAGAPGTPPDPDRTIASGSRVEVAPDGGCRVAAMPGAQLLTLGLPLDLNRATADDLAAIPGLGPALARRIVDYRTAHGPFQHLDALGEIPGIGPQNLTNLKPYLGLGGPAAITAGPSPPGISRESREGQLPGGKSGLQPQTPGRRIDPNLASPKDLETLPGIGPVLAQRIIDYRRAHGPYKKIADLQKVCGIGPKKLEKLRPYVIITSRKPPASGQ